MILILYRNLNKHPLMGIYIQRIQNMMTNMRENVQCLADSSQSKL